MSNKTQLSEEVIQSIEEAANDYVEETRGRQGRVETYIAGATEYATKLHQVEQEREDIKKEKSIFERNELIMITLLKEVFLKHESGLLPDRFIYEKIKRFLYGEE